MNKYKHVYNMNYSIMILPSCNVTKLQVVIYNYQQFRE